MSLDFREPRGGHAMRALGVGPLAILAFGTMIAQASSPSLDATTHASLTGAWTITISTEQGEFDTGWELEQHDDGTLTGTIEGRQGEAEAESGWVKDDAFGFAVTREFQGQSFKIEYEGTYTDASLEGTLTAGGGQFTADFTGVRAEGDDK